MRWSWIRHVVEFADSVSHEIGEIKESGQSPPRGERSGTGRDRLQITVAATQAPAAVAPVHLTVLHGEIDLHHRVYVVERVARQCDDVGAFSRFDHALSSTPSTSAAEIVAACRASAAGMPA
jgi:hypothetical protein